MSTSSWSTTTTWSAPPGVSTTPTSTSTTNPANAAGGQQSTTTAANAAAGATSSSTSTTSQPTGVESTSTAADSVPSTSDASIPTNVSLPSATAGNHTTSLAAPSALHHAGVSKGALAGAIVGSIAGTALLALLVGFLFLRSAKKKYQRQAAVPTTDRANGSLTSTRDKSSYLVGTPLFDPSPYFLDAADDNAIYTRIQTLFDQASLHVDNFYTHAAAILPITPTDAAQFQAFDSPEIPAPLATLLANPRSQRGALTHALVHTLVEAMSPASEQASLLPPQFTWGPGVGLDMERDHSVFIWRMLSYSLYTKRGKAKTGSDMARSDASIRGLAESFSRAFAAYSDSHYPEASRVAHLTNVVREAADLGIWLFGQPCTFGFTWRAETANEFVVLPGVVKVCDERGRRLPVPQVLGGGTAAVWK